MEFERFDSPDDMLHAVKIPSSKAGDKEQETSSESITMSTQDDNISEAGDKEPEIPPEFFTMDDEGDIILNAGSILLRVSSNVLRLASPVFCAMLKPGRFLEGSAHRDSHDPFTVQLEDDDPGALIMLCNILHFKKVEFTRNVKLIVTFTDLCDKYCCFLAPLFAVKSWLSLFDYSDHMSPHLMLLLWVAYAFNLPTDFEKITTEIAKHLDKRGADNMFLHVRLPVAIGGSSSQAQKQSYFSGTSLTSAIDDIGGLRKIIIYRAIQTIRSCVEEAKMDKADDYTTNRKQCKDCDRVEYSGIQKCQCCGNTTFRPMMCKPSTRCQELTSWLEESTNVWPLSKQLQRSPLQILGEIYDAVERVPFHVCEGAAKCPLCLMKAGIITGVRRVLDRAPGLKLATYRAL